MFPGVKNHAGLDFHSVTSPNPFKTTQKLDFSVCTFSIFHFSISTARENHSSRSRRSIQYQYFGDKKLWAGDKVGTSLKCWGPWRSQVCAATHVRLGGGQIVTPNHSQWSLDASSACCSLPGALEGKWSQRTGLRYYRFACVIHTR